MRVLVAYASKHGATRAVAERIGGHLADAGLDVDVLDARDADGLGHYHAFVLGSAVYNGHWRPEAVVLVERLEASGGNRPVWLFSSGPLGAGPPSDDIEGGRAGGEPEELVDIHAVLRARDHRVFGGALDLARLTRAERARRALPGGRALLPEGDFRDWAQIDAWAAAIAGHLVRTP